MCVEGPPAGVVCDWRPVCQVSALFNLLHCLVPVGGLVWLRCERTYLPSSQPAAYLSLGKKEREVAHVFNLNTACQAGLSNAWADVGTSIRRRFAGGVCLTCSDGTRYMCTVSVLCWWKGGGSMCVCVCGGGGETLEQASVGAVWGVTENGWNVALAL